MCRLKFASDNPVVGRSDEEGHRHESPWIGDDYSRVIGEFILVFLLLSHLFEISHNKQKKKKFKDSVYHL